MTGITQDPRAAPLVSFEVHVVSGAPTVADLSQLYAQFGASLSKGYPCEDRDLGDDDELADTWTGLVTGPSGVVYRIEERWAGGMDECAQDYLKFKLPWSLDTDQEHGPGAQAS